MTVTRAAVPDSFAGYATEYQLREAERSLRAFFRQAWSQLEPQTPFVPNWHIDCISEHLEAVSAGEITRLIINVPPRMSKSLLVAVAWPCWEWIRLPWQRWIFTSYSGSLSAMHSLARRNLITSPWYRRRWGGLVRLKADQNQKSEFENTASGRMTASSITGTTTGKGGNRLIMDDPQDPMQAASDVERRAAIDYYTGTLSTRLDDRKTGAIVLIMQRLHEQDLTGYILGTEPGWMHLKMPMRSEERTEVSFPRSERTVMREAGALLCPARYGEKEDGDARRTMGSYLYAGQMQQSPVPAGGGIFRTEFVRFYGGPGCPPLPTRFLLKVQSWDLAFKAVKTSDRVAGSVWGSAGADFYLLEGISDQMGVLDSARAIEAYAYRHPDAGAKLIEDAANGPAVCEILRSRIPGLMLLSARGGKEARAFAVQPFWEAGNIWLPHPSAAPWVTRWIDSITHFPRWNHDDEVDSMTQAILYLVEHGRAASISFDVPKAPPIFHDILTTIL